MGSDNTSSNRISYDRIVFSHLPPTGPRGADTHHLPCLGPVSEWLYENRQCNCRCKINIKDKQKVVVVTTTLHTLL